MNNELLLMSKQDIPYMGALVQVHQPSINEIALVGEKNFLSGCQMLNFSKEKDLAAEEQEVLKELSDFEVFMSIMRDKTKAELKNNVMFVLALLFPTHTIKFAETEIMMANEAGMTRINNTNYDELKDIIVNMFCLNESEGGNGDFNPIDKRAAKIAEKFKKRKAKIADEHTSERVAIYSRYVSILAVGERKDMNELMEYSVFQLNDEFKRFQMKTHYDFYMQAKMAGAKDLDEVDNWMDDLYGSSSNN